MLASPVAIINCTNEVVDIEAVLDIVRQQQVEQIIVGLPMSMSGETGKQAEKVVAFVKLLRTHTDVPVEFRDERLSTVAAERLKRPTKTRKTREKTRYDAMAAAIILQGYLDEVAFR